MPNTLNKITRIAILASGSGSNTENIIRRLRNSENLEVSLVLSNRKDAPVLEKAARLGVKSSVISKDDLDNDNVNETLKAKKIDLIILAGFLLKIPSNLIKAFPGRIINIHPSLLPRHGGKGMYGGNVHAAVLAAGDQVSGITIHLVNSEYDKGRILFQAKCDVDRDDTPESLAAKVLLLEHLHFPEVIREYALELRARPC